jgi:hypothetical protein
MLRASFSVLQNRPKESGVQCTTPFLPGVKINLHLEDVGILVTQLVAERYGIGKGRERLSQKGKWRAQSRIRGIQMVGRQSTQVK